MRVKRFIIILLTLLFFAVGAAIAQDVTPPVVSSVTVLPQMAAPGDTVHIVAEVTDDTAVTSVTADSVPLTFTEVNKWEGDISASSALGIHNVTVIASDEAGNTCTDSSAAYTTAQVLGIGCKDALSTLLTQSSSFVTTHLFKVWGKCTYIDENSFWIDDGSGSNHRVKVVSAGHVVCSGDFVAAYGGLDPSAAPAIINNARCNILVMGQRQEINIGNATVGKDLMTSLNGYLPSQVQYGTKLKVVITSSDPSKVTLSKTTDAVGSSSITLTVNGGSSNLPTFYVHGLADSGTVNVTAMAQGGLGKVFKVTLAPSGFVIYNPGNFSTTSFANNTDIDVRPAMLDSSTHAYAANLPLRPGVGPVSVPVNISCVPSDTQVGTITINPLSIAAGQYNAKTQFDPVGAGTATISISAPEGFTTPANKQSITATVTASSIIAYDVSVGRDLQTSTYCSLQVAPPEPVDMTVTVDSPTVATLTTDPAVEGTASITFSGVANSNSKVFYVQGRSVGTAKLTVSAPGYNSVEKTVTVNPSGFVIYSPSSISTTTFASNTSIDIRPAMLNAGTLTYSAPQTLRGGIANVTVPVSISNTGAGVLTAYSVTIGANVTSAKTEFDPVGAGTATISISTPDGFTTPANKQSITATITASSITAYDTSVGRDLQVSTYCSLQVAPPQPVDVTVTVGSSSVATVTTDPAVEGSSSVIFSGVTSTASKTFYVQGRSIGTTTMTVSAPGYNPVVKTITVNPSGFMIYNPSSINTTYYSASTDMDIRSVMLNASNLTYSAPQNLRGGITSVTVPVAISDGTVGTLSANSITLQGNTGSAKVSFQPVATGSAVISVSTPDGFQTSATRNTIPVTVVVPNVTTYDVCVGRDLQTNISFYLQTAPPQPVDVTITVGSSSVATVTTDPLVEGTSSVTFSGVGNTSSRAFYVQGRGLGTTTLTISAPGYSPVEKTITVNPSGFVICSPSSITTKVGAVSSSLDIRPARLDPVNYTYSAYQQLRGGLTVNVDVVSSNVNIGSITVSPLTFDSNGNSAVTKFTPLAAGTCTVSVVPPEGFSTPTTRREIDVTVNQ
ncbi:MAG: hypothetical protein ABFD64_08465 [Armatimonadota bacterium]